MNKSLVISSAAISDRGLSENRPQNEDSFLDMDRVGIFAVADGVGGAQAGEVASQMAVELLGEAFTNLTTGSDAETVMRAAIGQANSAIHQMAHELPQLASMATTIVALHIAGDIATIGHVGDSRLYRVDEDGRLFRETDDHSMVADEVRAGRMTEEQAENHPSRNIINRALGAESLVDPDLKTIMIDPGTTFLLCSDGITRHVTDAEIKGVLTFGRDPKEICDYLKGLCFERGAEDNLTAVVVRASRIPASVTPTYELESLPADILDVEEPTIASARSPFEEKVSINDDSLLELETAELSTSSSTWEVQDIDDEVDTSPLPDFDPSITSEIPDDTESFVPDHFIAESPIETIGASPDEVQPAPVDEEYSDFGSSGATDEIQGERSGVGSILTAIGMLVLGAAIGLGVYHFTFAPKPADRPLPQLSEMKSANIPLSAFEENRRNVDKDPAGYLAHLGGSAQDCEDHYLLGRAYLLVGDHVKAKAELTEARNLLSGADPVNERTLATDIAVALSITDEPAAQVLLKRELEDPVKPGAITNANR